MRAWLRLFCWLGILAIPSVTVAQDYPSRAIELIVPYPAGGPTDLIGRVLGRKMSELLGQPVVIENKGGVGGVLGTDAVAKAAPDGYTLGLSGAGALAISASLLDRVPFDATKDLETIALVAAVPELLVVGPALPAASLTDLVAMAKAKPGELNFASSGQGSMTHLAGELLKITAGIDIVHVPYKGAAPAVNDLLGAHVEMMFADMPVLLPHVRSGALKALAVASKARVPALPDVPTMAELGLPQVEAENWYGIVAPSGTSPAVVAKLHATIVEALKAPEVAAQLSSQGAILVGSTPEEFAAYVGDEIAKWAKVVQASGAKAN